MSKDEDEVREVLERMLVETLSRARAAEYAAERIRVAIAAREDGHE